MPENALKSVQAAEAQARQIRQKAEEDCKAMRQKAEEEGKAQLALAEEELDREIREQQASMYALSENLRKQNREEALKEAEALRQEARAHMRGAVNVIVLEIQRLCQ